MKRLALALCSLSVIAPVSARAQAPAAGPVDVARLFSHVAPVEDRDDSTTAHRLPLSAEALAVCRADLSDVRLYAGGVEVPWILDSASRTVVDEVPLLDVEAPVLETPRHELERPPHVPNVYLESYEIPGPGATPARARWQLSLRTSLRHFVAAARVVVVEADGTEREIGHRDVFRLMDPSRDGLAIDVEDPGAGVVRVELRGTDGYLEPTFHFVATRAPRSSEELVIPLAIVSQTRVGTETTLVLTRPEGVSPEALRFATSTGAFVRDVTVEVPRGAAGSIWRVPGERVLERLDVGVPPIRTPTITVHVEDGDSPPLGELAVSAVLSRPALVYFQGADTLRLGGGRVRAAHYDLDALLGSWAVDRALDGSTPPIEATLGAIARSPAWNEEPALAGLQRPGVPVPAGDHALTAPLEVTSATEGVSAFVLDAAVLGAARVDLADLRVVDAEGRQWPYLLRERAPLELPVTLGVAVRDGERSSYAISLPAPRVSASGLRLDPEAQLVSRDAEVNGTDGRGDPTELWTGTLSRYPDDPSPLFLGLGATPVTAMALEVVDGGDAPLGFRSATIVLPTQEVVLVAPPGHYRVLVGDDDARPPTYEIEAIRGLLDTVPIDVATLGALAPSPDFHVPTFWERTGTSTLVLWAVLVLAILVLGVLTWRVSHAPDAPEAPVAAPPASAPANAAPAPSSAPAAASPAPAPVPEGSEPEQAREPEPAREPEDAQEPEDGDA